MGGKRLKTWKVLGASLMVPLLLIGCDAPPSGLSTSIDPLCGGDQPDSLIEFPVKHGGATTSDPYVLWGIEENCFAAEGLDVVNLGSAGGNADKLASLLGGQARVAAESPIEFLSAVANQNEPLEIVVGINEVTQQDMDSATSHQLVDGRLAIPFALLASSDSGIQSFADLAGTRIGVAPGEGIGSRGLTRTLANEGIGPGDVELVPLAAAERRVAFERGDLDGAVFYGATVFSLLDLGARMIGYPTLSIPTTGPYMLWYTTAEIASTHSGEIEAFKRAMVRVNSLLNEPANQERFISFLVEDYGMDRAVAERWGVARMMERDVTSAEILAWSDFLVEEGLVDQAPTEEQIVIFLP